MKILVLIFIPFCCLSCFKEKAIENKFYIESVEARLVDLIDMDLSHCVNVSLYNHKRNNDTVGIGILFKKRFYVDATESHGSSLTMGVLPKGMKGAQSRIKDFNIYVIKDDTINLTDEFFQLEKKIGIDLDQARFDREMIVVDRYGTCAFVEQWLSINEFVDSFNTNAINVTGENLNMEMLFWIHKKRIKNMLNDSSRVVLQIIYSDSTSHHVEVE